MATRTPGVVRGSIIKIPGEQPGLVFADGQQWMFRLEGQWLSPIAPALNQPVDIEFDDNGEIRAIRVVDIHIPTGVGASASHASDYFADQTQGGQLASTLLKITGWFFIAIGAIFTLTIVGAIVGIPGMLFGGTLVWVAKRIATTVAKQGAAAQDLSEILDHQLQTARQAKVNSKV